MPVVATTGGVSQKESQGLKGRHKSPATIVAKLLRQFVPATSRKHSRPERPTQPMPVVPTLFIAHILLASSEDGVGFAVGFHSPQSSPDG
ncbi:hypothetical protein FHS27_002376, partial [Rhodopirellula rubra]|nr:hypothetical protein [Aporhodopirellula rubra]